MKMMKRSKKAAIVLLLAAYQLSFAAFENMPAGARVSGFADAAAAFHYYENLYYNPAGMWLDSGAQIGALNGKLFGLDDLQHNSVTGVFHLQRLTVGLGIQTFGNNNYRESTACIGICTKVNQAFYAGAALRYASLAIKGYGQAGAFLVDIGGQVRLAPQLYWGWAVRNINYAVIGQCREKLPQSIITGIQLCPVKAVTLNMDLYKDIRFPAEYRSGIEIDLLTRFQVRSGIATAPSRVTAGFGLKVSHIQIDYAFNTHPYLKLTHLFSLLFTIGN